MRLTYILLLVGVALVFYLSWVPDPRLNLVWFVPHWVARWTDSHANDDLRTAVPFLFLGVFAGSIISSRQQSAYWWFIWWLILIGVVFIAEIGQLLLPKRHFTWADIGWGALGAFIGLGTAMMLQMLKSRRIRSS